MLVFYNNGLPSVVTSSCLLCTVTKLSSSHAEFNFCVCLFFIPIGRQFQFFKHPWLCSDCSTGTCFPPSVFFSADIDTETMSELHAWIM